jgi:YVTN family beta-propeller protein
MRRFFPAGLSVPLLLVLTIGGVLLAQEPFLRKMAQLELPGPKGKRFDYATIDPDDHFVIVAHMHGDQTYFVDTRTNQLGATITDTPGVEGVEYVPDQKKVYTSNSGDNTIGVIDIAQRKVIKKLKTEAKPDGSTYAAPFHKLYVSDERGKAVAIVDVRTDTIVKTLHFDSETGMPQYDPVTKLVYVNLQDTERFVVIDPQDDRVVAKYPVADCRGNHGMALAPEQHRAFLVCEGNDRLAVFDLEKHVVIQIFPLPGGGDVVKSDPRRGRVFVACYSGAISAFQALASGQYKKILDAPVEKRVHSLAINPETGYLYVPEEQEKGAPASRLIVYSLPGAIQ